jgi:hypothetical protein
MLQHDGRGLEEVADRTGEADEELRSFLGVPGAIEDPVLADCWVVITCEGGEDRLFPGALLVESRDPVPDLPRQAGELVSDRSDLLWRAEALQCETGAVVIGDGPGVADGLDETAHPVGSLLTSGRARERGPHARASFSGPSSRPVMGPGIRPSSRFGFGRDVGRRRTHDIRRTDIVRDHSGELLKTTVGPQHPVAPAPCPLRPGSGRTTPHDDQ